jgi:ubiquinone/menaquinone biosynthesis C-methylase UbiE
MIIRRNRMTGTALIVLGFLMVAAYKYLDDFLEQSMLGAGAAHLIVTPVLVAGAMALLAGLLVFTGRPINLKIHEFELIAYTVTELARPASKAEPPTMRQRKAFSARRRLPGDNAAPLNVLEDRSTLRIGPGTDPSVPSYVLDQNFRIVDWNDAFNLCFDYTMEGRRGMSVLEWTYFLDNYEQVVEHGIHVFGGEGPLPPIDIEEIEYTSDRYGVLTAVKRAYMIPNDDRQCAGWLAVLDVTFADKDQASVHQRDLVNIVARDVMWSEYALSYDAVLTNTDVYPALMKLMLGEDASMPRIAHDAKILDLGAGTGTFTERLAAEHPERLVVAVENNRTMLALLRDKVRPLLRTNGPRGVVPLKQDITTLLGLEDEGFDVAIMNNVLYSVDDVPGCLREVHRVLRERGEIRISGPQKRTRLDRLLKQIKSELKTRGLFDELEQDYERVRIINERRLAQWLYRWSIDDMKAMLREAGFRDVFYESDRAYGGESMVIGARKGA